MIKLDNVAVAHTETRFSIAGAQRAVARGYFLTKLFINKLFINAKGGSTLRKMLVAAMAAGSIGLLASPATANADAGLVVPAKNDPIQSSYAAKELWTGSFDAYFKKYAKQYFGPFFDWQWFKAQAIAESKLTINAESWAGAQGIMQIMPATYADIQERNPHFSTVDKPRWNIAAGIFYNQYLYTKLSKVPEPDRLMLTFAAYNAGLGNVYKAQRKAGGSTVWKDLKPYLPRETQGYVERILLVREYWVLHPGDIPAEVLALAAKAESERPAYDADLPEVGIPGPSRARAVVKALPEKTQVALVADVVASPSVTAAPSKVVTDEASDLDVDQSSINQANAELSADKSNVRQDRLSAVSAVGGL